MNIKYNHIAIGGTFDRFHNGHKEFIRFAFDIGKKVSIGITSQKLDNTSQFVNEIEPFEERMRAVETYLRNNHLFSRSHLIRLNNMWGTAVDDVTLDAIVVTKETRKNALLINKERKTKGLRQLDIMIVPFVKGEDKKIIRSERIRKGEIDRTGHIYGTIFKKKNKLILPAKLRAHLQKPLGMLIPGDENSIQKTARGVLQKIKPYKSPMIITVGDIISLSLIGVGFDPDLKIIDLMTKRLVMKDEWKNIIPLEKIKRYVNRAGTLERRVFFACKLALQTFLTQKTKQTIIILGEEDLTTLLAILLAPLNSIVLYGQVGLGVVMVMVTEQKKKETEDILKQFNTLP